jgi:uncharacterized protein (TIGR03437 family)
MRLLLSTLAILTVAVVCSGQGIISFEANHGQIDPRVQFLSRGQDHTLFLTSTEAVLRTGHDVFRMKLAGANPASKAEGMDPQIARSNYFIGNDPAKWRTGVTNYARVRFTEVYPGIDLVYYGRDGQLEYDWIVKPGADASKIHLKFAGIQKMRVDSNGDLVLVTPTGEVREKKPVVYQSKEISGRYVLRGRAEAGFQVGPYDASRPLVIDPVLGYSTYLGGSDNDYGNAIAVDAAGNAYVTGCTGSTDFPIVNPKQSMNQLGSEPGGTVCDAFISKVGPDGSTLLYSTFLGGNGDDQGRGIAVDSLGNAFVTGFTTSTNFPTSHAIQNKQHGAFSNAFVTKLNPAGNTLLFSTYLGGRVGDQGLGIALDTAGNAYITGHTSSDDFPLLNPIQVPAPTGGTFPSAFVTKMSGDGSALVYSTFLGGYNGGDFGQGIAVDSSGSAYVTGWTQATDFVTVNPLQPANDTAGGTAFVTKINPSGSAYVYSTYLGGSLIDKAYAIAADSSGNAYVAGWTNSSDFPTVHAFQSTGGPGSAFVSKINATGSALEYSTYLGSSGAFGYGIAVNSAGEAWVTGVMPPPPNFPIVNPLMNSKLPGIFASHFSADGSALLFSSLLWTGVESQGGIAVDSARNAYVAGTVGNNNPSTPTGFQKIFGGGQNDAFVLKVAIGPAVPSISSTVNGASFQPPIVPNSWATVQGSSLASVTDTWAKAIVNGKLPTMLDNLTVTVGGQRGYLYYISPTQINFVAPNVGPGPQQVVVTNAAGASAAFTVASSTFGPAFFPWPNNQVVATRQDFTFAAKNGTFAGTTTVAAKPGDVIILWGTGFGPTTPAAPTGMQVPGDKTYSTSTLPAVTIDNLPAKVFGAALAPGYAGLYQVAIQVPASLADGDWPVVATIGNVQSPAGMVLSVKK